MLSTYTLGFFYMLTSTTSFAIMAAVSKKIGAQATSNEKLFWRAVLSSTFALLENAWRGRRIGRPKHPGLMLLRGLCGHIATVAFFEAINLMPLGECAFLAKIHPLAAAAFGRLFLAEELRWSRVVAMVTSLGGVALIAKPSAAGIASGSALGVALALFAGVLSGAAYCCVRALLRKDETELWVVLAFPMVSAPVGVMDALKHISGDGLDISLLLWFLALGVFTQGGQIFLARGLQLLPVAIGTHIMFLGSVVSVVLGVLMGDAVPEWNVWAGGAVIFASLQLAEVGQDPTKKRA